MAAHRVFLLPLLLLLTMTCTTTCSSTSASATAAAATKPKPKPATPLPHSVLSQVAQALQRAGGGTQRPGPRSTYMAASLLLPHYLGPLTRARTTLLLPTDASFLLLPHHPAATAMPLLSAMPAAQLRSLARFHMLTANLTFANLLTLPSGALLPTLLGDAYRLRIDYHDDAHSSPAARDARFTIAGAHIIHPDLCPASVSHIVTCHGIDRILLSTSAAPLTPASTSPGLVPVPALAPSPGVPAPVPAAARSSGSYENGGNPASSTTGHHVYYSYVVANGSYAPALPAPPSPAPSSSSGRSSISSKQLASAAVRGGGATAGVPSLGPAPLAAKSSAAAGGGGRPLLLLQQLTAACVLLATLFFFY